MLRPSKLSKPEIPIRIHPPHHLKLMCLTWSEFDDLVLVPSSIIVIVIVIGIGDRECMRRHWLCRISQHAAVDFVEDPDVF